VPESGWQPALLLVGIAAGVTIVGRRNRTHPRRVR